VVFYIHILLHQVCPHLAHSSITYTWHFGILNECTTDIGLCMNVVVVICGKYCIHVFLLLCPMSREIVQFFYSKFQHSNKHNTFQASFTYMQTCTNTQILYSNCVLFTCFLLQIYLNYNTTQIEGHKSSTSCHYYYTTHSLHIQTHKSLKL